VLETAEEIGVPMQTSFIEGGATDGAAIHLHNTGVPTVVIGVPARHIHSRFDLHRDDYDNAAVAGGGQAAGCRNGSRINSLKRCDLVSSDETSSQHSWRMMSI
jgi:hypothetical protein